MYVACLSLGVFAAMVVLDYAWARYTRFVAEGARTRAALTSALVTGLSYGLVWLFAGHPWYVLPTALGAGLGTWLGVSPPPKGPPPGVDVRPI